MRKSFLMAALLIGAVITTNACEICGCGNNNFQIGILPNFNKGFIGYRYTASRFHSVMSSDVTQYSHDYYKTLEIWGGYNFRKLQIMAFVPYLFSRKVSDDGVTVTNGAGDLLLLVNYKILGSSSLSQNEKVSLRNDLFIGGGIKLPTGTNRVDITNPDFNIGDFNSQAGTGTVDYILNVTHNIMFNNSGVVTNLTYRINTTNPQHYHFGNRSYVNTSYYYTLAVGNTKLKPNAGIHYQHNVINTFQGVEVESSNGYTLSSTFGINLVRGKIGFNALTFLPLKQNMYDGQTKLQSRTILGVTYSW